MKDRTETNSETEIKKRHKRTETKLMKETNQKADVR